MSRIDPHHRWTHRATATERHTVFPDGCRDVIIMRPAGLPAQVVFTDLDWQPRVADIQAGTELEGFRLRPGAVVSADTLAQLQADSEHAADILRAECGPWSDWDDGIVALTQPDATVALTARQLGVSLRTLQRWFASRGLPPPEFWRQLARARRAAAQLATAMPLAQIAADSHYSDQAHLSRELRRWFGLNPSQLRQRADVLEELRQPALGNWTGEQISTK